MDSAFGTCWDKANSFKSPSIPFNMKINASGYSTTERESEKNHENDKY